MSFFNRLLRDAGLKGSGRRSFSIARNAGFGSRDRRSKSAAIGRGRSAPPLGKHQADQLYEEQLAERDEELRRQEEARQDTEQRRRRRLQQWEAREEERREQLAHQRKIEILDRERARSALPPSIRHNDEYEQRAPRSVSQHTRGAPTWNQQQPAQSSAPIVNYFNNAGPVPQGGFGQPQSQQYATSHYGQPEQPQPYPPNAGYPQAPCPVHAHAQHSTHQHRPACGMHNGRQATDNVAGPSQGQGRSDEGYVSGHEGAHRYTREAQRPPSFSRGRRTRRQESLSPSPARSLSTSAKPSVNRTKSPSGILRNMFGGEVLVEKRGQEYIVHPTAKVHIGRNRSQSSLGTGRNTSRSTAQSRTGRSSRPGSRDSGYDGSRERSRSRTSSRQSSKGPSPVVRSQPLIMQYARSTSSNSRGRQM